MTARKRFLIAAVGVTALLASGAFAWKATRAPASQVASRPVAAARPLELISQEVHTIKPRGLVDIVRFTGTTQPIDQTVVKARVAGRLAEVLVREGDKVAKGQLLARFETTELQAKVN
jgi:multidrug efflux system membrane fusion protein